MVKGKSLVLSGVAILAILVLMLFLSSKIIILGAFGKIEDQLVRQDVGRVFNALGNELANLERSLTDWSEWDDTASFIDGNAPNYLKANLLPETFADLGLNLMIFIDSDGRIVYGGSFDRAKGTLTGVPTEMLRKLSPSARLVRFEGKGITGLIPLSEGPLLVASHWITASGGDGPRKGTLVFGRYLDSGEIQKLSRITHIDLEFQSFGRGGGSPDIWRTLQSEKAKDGILVRADNDNTISGYRILKDIYGNPVSLLHVKLPRTVYNSGKKTVFYFLGWITGLAILSCVVILLLLDKLLATHREKQEKESQRRMEEEMEKARKIESLGVLAGGIAHDFNNLLTGILGNISLAKRCHDSSGKAYERLLRAEKASERARELTRQLLTFSKGGAPVRKTASISELIEESAGFVMRGSNIGCEISLPPDLWPVSVDQGQISQVVNNLVINARQAMPHGGVIKIRGENISIGSGHHLPLNVGRYVRISVSDTGVGISPENLRKIFDPYFTTKQTGSGLGLASVYSIVKNHEGHVDVESKEGAGTTFSIYLPASDELPETLPGAEGEPVPTSGKGNVLVMDDEEIIREVAAEILQYLGYNPVLCAGGVEALEIYRSSMAGGQPFQAVIMDLTVPGGMGGKEAVESLLEMDPGAKVIVSSGYCNDPVLANYTEYGFFAMLAKPFKVENFSEVLEKI